MLIVLGAVVGGGIMGSALRLELRLEQVGGWLQRRLTRRASPDRERFVEGFVVASLLFALYVAKFASYNKTYGSMGGVIVFLLWLWITNLAILFGAEFNSELQRSQQRAAGEPAPLDEPFLEPRDTTKLDKKAAK